MTMEVDGATDGINIVTISGAATIVVVQIVIGIVACRGMLQNKVNVQLKGLFIVSWLSACIIIPIGSIIYDVHEMRTGEQSTELYVIAMTSGMLFFVFLLLTLVLRLRLTFKDSIYRMSQCTYCVFIGILVSLPVIPPILFNVFNVDPIVCVASFIVIFLVGAALAVYFFVRALYKLTLSRNESMSNSNMNPENVSLDKFQQKMINLAARYLLLFGIATFSSILLTVGCMYLFFGISELFMFIDLCINLFCMYLQFSFAKNVYFRCCGCLDKLCRRAIWLFS